MAKQKRLTGVELPKPIIALQNNVDALERLKKKRATTSEQIKDLEWKIAQQMIKAKTKLSRSPNGGILYKLNGYRVEVFDKQVVKATHEEV